MKPSGIEVEAAAPAVADAGPICPPKSKPQDVPILSLPDPWTADPYEDLVVTTPWHELVAAYRRGNGKCGICGLMVDLAVERGLMQPTIDHIVPKSRLGGDERTNLRIAHRGCNSRKGNR